MAFFNFKAIRLFNSTKKQNLPGISDTKERIDLIVKSGLFDSNWYREKRGLGSANDIAAIADYLTHASDNIAPHPLFDVAWFRRSFPELATNGYSPLEVYIAAAQTESISPNLLFDPIWYSKLAAVPAPMQPFLHFLRDGAAKGLSPHPLFDSRYYVQQDPALGHGGVNPLTHFIEIGARSGLNPNRYFSSSWYLSTYRPGNRDPLSHFLEVGVECGHRPHPLLDLDRFMALEGLTGSRLDSYRTIVVNDLRHALQSGDDPASTPHNRPPQQLRNGEAWLLELNLTSFATALKEDDCLPLARPAPLNIDNRGAEAITFDIWDTVLRRDCHPDEIKTQSARYLLLRAHDLLRPAFRNIPALFAARVKAENASAPNDEFEFRFEEAVPRWLDMALRRGTAASLRQELQESVIRHEFQAERRSTRVDGPVRDALVALQQPAVFASDFYMSADFIKALLHEHGLSRLFVTGFASSDSFETKRSGRMFAKLMGELGIEASSLLHVGDNKHADEAVPKGLGIRTVLYQPEGEASRRSWLDLGFEAWQRHDMSVHHRRLAGVCEEIALEQGRVSELHAIGARLAPVVVGYALSVLEAAIKDNIDKIFFFTREGIFVKKVFDALCEADPFNCRAPSSELLEVSRRATFAASLEDATPKELMRLWTLYSKQSLRGLTLSLNLDEKLVQRLCHEHGVTYDKIVTYPWQDSACLALLQSQRFLEHARERIATQREFLVGYLRQRGSAEAGLKHIVDIGWRGTIQDNLAKILPDTHFVGHYLGLFQFLNPQLPNTSKFGWIFDTSDPLEIADVAPLEMLLNGPGGSVSGYELDGDKIRATRQVIPGEEDVILNEVAAVQAGVLATVSALADYIRLHGLTSESLRPLARALVASLTANPPAAIAAAFNRLEHNETFGTGETDEGERWANVADELSRRRGSELHAFAGAVLREARWPQALIHSPSVANWWAEAPVGQRCALPTKFLGLARPALQQIAGSRLLVYVPPPLAASGGHRTIYNMVRRLSKLGFNPEILLEGVGDGVETVERYLDGTSALIHTSWHHSISADLAFATVAHSSQFISAVNAPNKAYLVQDFEALFNPMSDAYIVAENSYTQGHQHYTIGNWLSHVLNQDYHAPSCPAGLGVDTSVYHPLPRQQPRERAICFLYQPDKPRRTPVLGIDALRLVKQAAPDVTIYVYGSNIPLHLNFPVENLGLIHDLNELNDLYNRCMAGLCISGSNPSRIPYEMMAAGCVPVDLYRYNNLMDHVPDTTMLAYQDSASIAEALLAVLDPHTFKRMSAASQRFAASRTLDWEMDVIANSVLAQIDGTLPAVSESRLSYTDEPIIAPGSRSTAAERFCRSQRELAERRMPFAATSTTTPPRTARRKRAGTSDVALKQKPTQ